MEMIAGARRYYPSLDLCVGDATALPLTDQCCDVLVSGTVLLHVRDYRSVIAESARVSRRWVVFHKTPIHAGETRCFTKSAYGVAGFELRPMGHVDVLLRSSVYRLGRVRLKSQFVYQTHMRSITFPRG